jgi:two-component system, NtrC family, response regulator AtoC
MDRRILVVDDSHLVCTQLSELLARPDRLVDVATDGTDALERLLDEHYSLALVDLFLPGINGLDLVRELRERALPVAVIVMTGYASIDSAVDAMKLGAYDYLTKPIQPEQLEPLVEQALRDRTLQDEVASLRQSLQERYGFGNLLGRSLRMREVFSRVARVASSACTVLITGETGTGKELVAQAIHYADATRTGPLVAINCAALPEPLLESELFGHERGAFTGAERQKKGRFEQAQGGTLFLDEIGELPLSMQAKLLRVLQDGTFERVGGTEPIHVETRVLAATNLNLSRAVADGSFRADLFYRLNVVPVELPPLRERPDDLPLLVDHFLSRLRKRGVPVKAFARETLDRMAAYHWPGNVRELEHLVELLVVTTPGPLIERAHLPPHIVATLEPPLSLDFDIERPLQEITEELTERVERFYIMRVLERFKGRIALCAQHCGLSRRSISEKLRRYQIDKKHFKPHGGRRKRVATAG